MKPLLIALTLFSYALTGWCEVFQMDRKGESTVEVTKSSGEYRVTCRFKPQTKFDKAVNAKFNDAKGDSLCKKGLARFLNVAADETLSVAGLYSAAPVAKVGDRLCYSFGVPVSGCKVVRFRGKPKAPAMPEKPIVVASVPSKSVASAAPAQQKKKAKPEKSEPQKTATILRSSAYIYVAKYKEVNGKRTAVSHKEYQGYNFKSPKEFEQFCQQEFARVRAVGEANLRAVRNSGHLED